jgi:glycosyltransferase involved in cell wall biosynthesis
MARAAQKAGFEVHVATRVNSGARAIEAEGFTLHPIPLRRGGISPLSAVRVILALRRIASRIKPDIAHHSGLQCSVYGSIAAFGKKFPYVSAMTGLGYVYTSTTSRTRLLRTILKWILPPLLDRPGGAVLVQNPDDRAALADLGINEARIVLIPGSGVDTDALQPLPEPEGPITYGFAGRLLTDKGIRALVAAHGIVRDQGLEANLLIAGNPDPANPASVSFQEVNEWTQRPGITWLRQIKDISSLWRKCHFAILPSHREGLPGSLMEAAACGRAMIATDAPGCREIAIDDQTGLLVPIEDPEALARAIVKLATSPELRARYGKAARELVVSKLSARIIGESVVRLYDNLTAANGTHPAAEQSAPQAVRS